MTLQLQDYDITGKHGFLASFYPDQVNLPAALLPVRQAALNLPRSLPSGRIRTVLAGLECVDMEAVLRTTSDAQQRLAMVHYSFLVQAYVWGEADAPQRLPAHLAVPIWALASQLGQQPLLPYSAYVLDNWGLLDRAEFSTGCIFGCIFRVLAST